MIAYASRTGTKRNLDGLRRAGWRLMISPKGSLRTEGFEHYALDNGAWHAYQHGIDFDVEAFEKALDALGDNADFIVVPDIVAHGFRSLEYSAEWLHRLHEYPRLMFAVQDGMAREDVSKLIEPHLPRVGIFVGGTTEWKLNTMAMWAFLAHEMRTTCHVGRVNSAFRIRACAAAGVDSFDGSNPSRYAVNLGALDCCRRIADMYAPS